LKKNSKIKRNDMNTKEDSGDLAAMFVMGLLVGSCGLLAASVKWSASTCLSRIADFSSIGGFFIAIVALSYYLIHRQKDKDEESKADVEVESFYNGHFQLNVTNTGHIDLDWMEVVLYKARLYDEWYKNYVAEERIRDPNKDVFGVVTSSIHQGESYTHPHVMMVNGVKYKIEHPGYAVDPLHPTQTGCLSILVGNVGWFILRGGYPYRQYLPEHDYLLEVRYCSKQVYTAFNPNGLEEFNRSGTI
jgi:hypothetical protein